VWLAIISNDCFSILFEWVIFQNAFALLLLTLFQKSIKVLPVWVGCCSLLIQFIVS